jgi:steroid delta-isomerase-like uncharacterized protein
MVSLRLVMVAALLLSACTTREKTPQPDTSSSAGASSAKQVVLAYMDAWNRHDSAAIDTLIAPEGTHEDMPSGFIATGPRGVHAMMNDMTAALPDYAWGVTDVIEGEPRLAVLWTWKGTFSGKNPAGKTVKNQPVSGKGMSLVVVENGKIRQMQNYYDEASLFKIAKP